MIFLAVLGVLTPLSGARDRDQALAVWLYVIGLFGAALAVLVL